jgi:small-conductance mechanosensitive channel
MESIEGIQVIIDLFQTIIKFLGRVAVQRQLIAFVLILFVAWYLSKPLAKWLGRLYGRWLEGQRKRVAAEGTESMTEDTHVRTSLQILQPLLQIAQLIAFPLIAIFLTSLTFLLFESLGWTSGLLVDASLLLVVFLAYRLFIGILLMLFNQQKVFYYETRFFKPLFVVIIILLIINNITELSALARVPLFPFLGGTLTLGTLFLATIGLYLWIVGTGFIQEVLQSVITNITSADPGVVEASLILFRYLMIAVAVIVVFQLIGIDATTLAAILGGLSIGIGFAMQDVLKNFMGGIILLFEGTVRPGDWIAVGDTIGRAEGLSIRSTTLRATDSIEYIVPNQEFLSSTIVAYTHSEPSLMIKVPVGVSYDSNVQEVQDVLIDVAKQNPDILPLPAPTAPLQGFGESTIDFELRGWIEDVQYKAGIEAGLRVMIVDAFAKNNIEMPNNQLDVHLRSGLPETGADSTLDDNGR